ncbi:MAG: SiaB family protein kinase [Pseudomonadota bacterium]
MIQNLYEFNKEMVTKGLLFVYAGPVTQQTLEGIGDTLRTTFALEENDFNVTNKVFAVVIEQMQNIIRYSAQRMAAAGDEPEPEPEIGTGIVCVGAEDGKFFVTCGNYIYPQDADSLEEQLAAIAAMNRDELKARYKQERKRRLDMTQKGAGLGFLEMARKSSKPIEFSFRPVNDEFTFFSLKVVV